MPSNSMGELLKIFLFLLEGETFLQIKEKLWNILLLVMKKNRMEFSKKKWKTFIAFGNN